MARWGIVYNLSSDKKLEDLKVLRRSPDLLNNVKISQGQLQLIMEQFCFYHIHFHRGLTQSQCGVILYDSCQ